MHNIIKLTLVWIYCPWHARARCNERADGLTSRTPITGILKMDRTEIMQKINGRLLEDDTVVEE